MTQIMKNKDIIGIIKSLPLDFMESTASELRTDYKAKKLSSIRLFTLLLLAFLRNSTMSQRFTCEQSSCELLDDFLGISIPVTPLSHSSLADRLATMNPVFFARVYEKVFGMAEKELGADELSSSDIIRVDTTLVAETSARLREGIDTGVNHRFGGRKRHIKYGMAYDGFSAVLEKVFTRQKESGEEIALAQTVKDTIRQEGAPGRTIVFDRGTTGYDNLCEIRGLCEEKKCHFVSRLKLNRVYAIEKQLLERDAVREDDEFEIMEDCMALLNRPSGSEYDNRPFRIVRVRFRKTRPRTMPSAKRRRYEPEMVLVSDQTETPAMEIVHQYRHRWSIEVFYRFLKQNLCFSHILSTSINGIQIMLYMTLTVAVLVRLFAKRNGIGNTLAMTRMIVQIENWVYLHPAKVQKSTSTPGFCNTQ